MILILPLLLILLSNFNRNHFADSASSSSSDYSTLVYKDCSKETFTDPNGSITGLFQCRGDLSGLDCYSCVSRLPVLSGKLCGKIAAARVQLLGCYMLYEVLEFSEISGMQLLYKTCGATSAARTGFQERRGTTFSSMENGVVGGHGFYAASYQDIYVMGQCEGDVGDNDCGECVNNAAEKTEAECENAISEQVFLHKCFISYSYYPNGVPRSSSSYGGSSFSYGSSFSGN
ncbi:hypothetical protein PIB30_080170 [Stylosanthes scabra]|uniref:Gnk2-homologous domain-containing protein n=1 Tax=Stylosanthes scabra TaxID=79078 RepID=A0ABU6UU02_9FABA|nr:hypothetical protein [Stylosanthes scabra]